jgi:hypothetical protein
MAEGFDRVFAMVVADLAGWGKAMMAEVAAALGEIGVAASVLDAADAPEVLEGLRGRRIGFVDCNHRMRGPVPLPKVSLMLDHPCARLADVTSGHPACEVLGWVDASHPAAARALGLPFRSIFLPHAGPAPAARPLPMAERDIDVFFAGALREPETREGWAAQGAGAGLRDLLFDTVERIDAGEAPMAALAAVAAARGVALDRAGFCRIIARAMEVAEMRRRHRVLCALPPVRLAIAADYLPQALRGRPNVTYLGFTDDFAAIRGWMARSRFVLNVTGKFPHGAHERIWFGMAEGAAILTDSSSFLAESFADGESILYLPERGDNIAGLPLTAATAQRLADAARETYGLRHTWTERVWPLWTALQSCV